jgi:ERCC4-type nuclease
MVKIIVDTREKAPKNIIKFHPNIEFKQLEVGDYACACGDHVGFERKEEDFFNMQKVLVQVEELKQAYEHPYLILTKPIDHFLNARRGNKMSKLGFIASLMVRGVTPLAVTDYYAMMTIINRVIMKHHDGVKRDYSNFNHVRHVSNKDVKLNVLTSLPGVGLDKAKIIRENYPSLSDFFIAPKKEIEALPTFGPKTAEKIFKCLNSP